MMMPKEQMGKFHIIHSTFLLLVLVAASELGVLEDEWTSPPLDFCYKEKQETSIIIFLPGFTISH